MTGPQGNPSFFSPPSPSRIQITAALLSLAHTHYAELLSLIPGLAWSNKPSLDAFLLALADACCVSPQLYQLIQPCRCHPTPTCDPDLHSVELQKCIQLALGREKDRVDGITKAEARKADEYDAVMGLQLLSAGEERVASATRALLATDDVEMSDAGAEGAAEAPAEPTGAIEEDTISPVNYKADPAPEPLGVDARIALLIEAILTTNVDMTGSEVDRAAEAIAVPTAEPPADVTVDAPESTPESPRMASEASRLAYAPPPRLNRRFAFAAARPASEPLRRTPRFVSAFAPTSHALSAKRTIADPELAVPTPPTLNLTAEPASESTIRLSSDVDSDSLRSVSNRTASDAGEEEIIAAFVAVLPRRAPVAPPVLTPPSPGPASDASGGSEFLPNDHSSDSSPPARKNMGRKTRKASPRKAVPRKATPRKASGKATPDKQVKQSKTPRRKPTPRKAAGEAGEKDASPPAKRARTATTRGRPTAKTTESTAAVKRQPARRAATSRSTVADGCEGCKD